MFVLCLSSLSVSKGSSAQFYHKIWCFFLKIHKHAFSSKAVIGSLWFSPDHLAVLWRDKNQEREWKATGWKRDGKERGRN